MLKGQLAIHLLVWHVLQTLVVIRLSDLKHRLLHLSLGLITSLFHEIIKVLLYVINKILIHVIIKILLQVVMNVSLHVVMNVLLHIA